MKQSELKLLLQKLLKFRKFFGTSKDSQAYREVSQTIAYVRFELKQLILIEGDETIIETVKTITSKNSH